MHENNPIFQSLAVIEERIQEKLTVGAIAESIHFSKYHYQRLFRETVGDSVMAYVGRRKMALAAEELTATDLSVLEIALKYGYDSHEGFTRSFRAYMGVTPVEYRKYHLSTHSRNRRKEKSAVMYSKATDEIIRELNRLIVAAMETAAEARRYGGKTGENAACAGKGPRATKEEPIDTAECDEVISRETVGTAKGNKETGGVAAYAQFWEFAAGRAEKTAGQIKEALESVTAIAQCPDEISARFLIIKAVEDAAYEASVTAFQTGLTIARALPEHRERFQPLCDRYDALAGQARMGAGKIAEFFQELSALIFRDMRQNGRKKLESCAQAGRAAAQMLSDSALPYNYIAEEILDIAEELSATPLEEVTLYLLEDASFRLEAARFAAEVDIWRQPQHRHLFDGISEFRARLEETLEFFRSLSEDAARALAEPGETISIGRTREKMYRDLAAQESLLLFCLKGEIQKLGDIHLNREQKAAFETICGKMREAIDLARQAAGGADGREEEKEKEPEENKRQSNRTGKETEDVPENVLEETGENAKNIGKLLQEACEEMLQEAERLGMYGGAIRYIAEEAKGPLKYLSGHQSELA